MSHVVTQSCCKDATCVPVCPAECIRPRPGDTDFDTAEMLYIDPRLCVDCGACIEACPVDAILPEDELTPSTRQFAALNRLYFDAGPGAVDRRDPTPTVPGQMGLAGEQRIPTPVTVSEPLRVALVGSGPSACYTAGELLARRPGTRITVFDRLPIPGGLVRSGVAPDHQDTKKIADLFDRTLSRDECTVVLGVEIGRDLLHDELREHFDAVVYATGASDGRELGIRGEELPGSHSAADFVAWYNGHPDAAGLRFDLSGERAVIIGNGNVALDVARMLAADIEYLARTDIADHALEALSRSRIREVVVLGRRGPAQAAFTVAELAGLVHTPGLDVVADLTEAHTGEVTGTGDAVARAKAAIIASLPRAVATGRRGIRLRFLRSPVEIVGEDRVTGLRIVRNDITTGRPDRAPASPDSEDIPCGLVLRSVGYRAQPVGGLPYDVASGTVPHREGRVVDTDGDVVPGVFVVGWLKRGPSGVIGSNRSCAAETVTALLHDADTHRLPVPTGAPGGLSDLVSARVPHAMGYAGARAIDDIERSRGRASGRPRVKLVDVAEMYAAARSARAAPAGTRGENH